MCRVPTGYETTGSEGLESRSVSAELMLMDISAQAALVRGGEVSALELVEAAIARLEGARELNVLVHEQFEAARAAAAAPNSSGPLAGVPFLLKDLGQPQAGLHGVACIARSRRFGDGLDGRALRGCGADHLRADEHS